jgi:enterochelin esterase-like enzyme
MARVWAVCGAALLLALLAGCEAFERYEPTPIVVVITAVPSPTPPPTASPTFPPTSTPLPTALPDAPTELPLPCADEQGQIINFVDNFSEVARENLRYLVYLPPCYFQTQRRFPVVYLFHGLSYREQQWEDIGLIRALDRGILEGTLPPMILVMPYLGVIGQLDQFPPQPSFERVILEEIMPQVERNFCTINNRQHRAIGGISKGGFWAYSIALRHPDTFSRVGGHSAFFPNNPAAIPAAFNPLELAASAESLLDPALRPALYMDNGAQDQGGRSIQLISSRLAARSIPHTYVVHPIGEHNNDYWAAHVSEYLAFYGAEWTRDYAALPRCVDPSP